MLDLTPFGFTPTESSIYETLLDLGPSSGYAVATSHLSQAAQSHSIRICDGIILTLTDASC